MSFRTGWSWLLGGVLTYAVLAPALAAKDIVTTVIPAGFFGLMPGGVALMVQIFQIPLWTGLIAVPLAIVMAFVAARFTGETDVTSTKALGPVTQMLFGAITPGTPSGQIRSAKVPGGLGLQAADLLTTLTTEWLLGAKPSHPLGAHVFDVVAGAGGRSCLQSDHPRPQRARRRCVAGPLMYRVDRGVQSLCRRSRRTAPHVAHGHAGRTRARRDPRVAGKTYPATPPPLPPSPAGLGIAMVLPGSNCVALFPDAAIAAGLRRNRPALAEKTRVPVASGLSTGDGLMGSASYS